MFNFILAAKRAAHSVYFPILLVLCTVVILFAPTLGKEEALPPAGVCDLDNTASSANVAASLMEEGFVLCSDEDTLRKKITSGEFDCGVIIKAGFSDALTKNELEDAAIFLTSPLSFSDELYKNHVSAAIFTQLVPVITAEIMGDTLTEIGVDAKDIAEEYHRRLTLGSRFTFEIENVGSDANSSDDRGKTYLMFFASILIFTAVMYSLSDIVSADISRLSVRIGIKNLLLAVVLPNLSVRILGIILSLTLSAVLEMLIFKSSIVMGLLPALFSYILLILSFSFAAVSLLRKPSDFRTLTALVLLLSLVLCPAYLDLSAMWRPAAIIRGFLPTYWLWFCEDFPLIWLGAIPILAPSSAIFALNSHRQP